MDESDAPEPKKAWFEPACAILMAVASVATAWCSYQSSNWSDRAGDLEAEADKLDRKAIALHLEALQIEAMQMRLFTEMVDARMEGNSKLEAFYANRFGDELKPAFEKWLALNPFADSAAPPHPFVPTLYRSRFEKEVRDTRDEAAHMEEQSSSAEHYASSYLSNTVSLATVLFFAGTAEKFDQRRVRWSALGFAIALFLFAAARMVILPVI